MDKSDTTYATHDVVTDIVELLLEFLGDDDAPPFMHQ